MSTQIVRRHDRTVHVKLYLTSDDTFNAIIVVDIAVVTDYCDSTIDFIGVDHPN
jgi:hypothetical protein